MVKRGIEIQKKESSCPSVIWIEIMYKYSLTQPTYRNIWCQHFVSCHAIHMEAVTLIKNLQFSQWASLMCSMLLDFFLMS